MFTAVALSLGGVYVGSLLRRLFCVRLASYLLPCSGHMFSSAKFLLCRKRGFLFLFFIQEPSALVAENEVLSVESLSRLTYAHPV